MRKNLGILQGYLLANNTLRVIQDLRNANASLGVAANFVDKNIRRMLTRNNVYFLSVLCSDLSNIEGMEELDSTERMITHLEQKKFNHIILYQNNEDKQLYNDVNPGDSMHRIAPVVAIANIIYFKCKYIGHTSRGPIYTLALSLRLYIIFITKNRIKIFTRT